MKKLSILIVLITLVLACMGLSSTTNSALFTLDTASPSITIIAPDGGEEWYIGDTNDILWTAEDTNISPNSVYLWYTMNGTSYLPLATAIANSGSFSWQMPDTESYTAKIRVKASDSFGNETIRNSASVFSITYVPPEPPNGVNVDTSNLIDAVITWQPVTETIYNTPITPDGYMVLYNETPYEDSQFYYYLGETVTETTYTHHNVARRRDQMFYRVIAFKDYDGRLANILSSADQNPEQKLSLADIKAELRASVGGGK